MIGARGSRTHLEQDGGDVLHVEAEGEEHVAVVAPRRPALAHLLGTQALEQLRYHIDTHDQAG